MMSWGIELWDQYDNIAIHTQKGLDFLEKYGHFIKDRCVIEVEYATKLKKLVKNYQPKKKDDEDNQCTTSKAFVLMMNEVNDLAGQHEVIAENLTIQINKELSSLLRELKEERKRYLHDGSKLQTNLQGTLTQLEKVKKVYEKAFKESEKAHDNFVKADADLNLSRAEVEKARNLDSLKKQLCEDSKIEYANQLQKFNDLQKQHYAELMPSVFEQLQALDEKRIGRIQKFIQQSSDVEQQVVPIINTCLDGVVKASNSINPKEDTKLVIEKYKSGYSPPSEIPFEDLSNKQNGDDTSSVVSGGGGGGGGTPLFKSETFRGTLSSGKLKKRGGLFGIFGSNKQNNIYEQKEDFSDLAPNQRRKKLQSKIDQIQSHIQQETSAREGLLKMKDVYEQNSSMGDPLSIEGQLAENGHRIEKLQAELRKYENYFAEHEGRPLPNKMSPLTHKRTSRNSISDESLSRSASDSSVSYPPNNNIVHKTSMPGTPIPSHGSSNSPESGIGTSHTSIPDEEFENNVDAVDNGEFEVEPLPVLGTCRALYPFEAQSEGSMGLYEGEELHIVELDQGDGWTRVRKDNYEEGFVPTSYIECFLYSNC